jgi:hypothetical protein
LTSSLLVADSRRPLLLGYGLDEHLSSADTAAVKRYLAAGSPDLAGLVDQDSCTPRLAVALLAVAEARDTTRYDACGCVKSHPSCQHH